MMCAVRKPIIRNYKENAHNYNIALDNLKCIVEDIHLLDDKEVKLLLESPVVYIHTWEKENKCNVYIGETNNFEKRTKQHYEAGAKQKLKKKDAWQKEIYEHPGNLFIVGHEHFNKSLTLDVENKLIEYIIASPNDLIKRNGRGNPQDRYYPDEEFDEIFNKIWLGLHNSDNKTFVKASEIHKSAIYKASPLHKLYEGQKIAKKMIIEAINNALDANVDGRLVFVEGEAGTGKTVVMSSSFYEFFSDCVDYGKKVKCCLVVNHNEQLTVYKQIMKRLGFEAEDIVYKPSTFIHKYKNNTSEKVDVVFVDEAHLLLTQGNQGYSGKSQLDDIISAAKITVAMYDEWQNLSVEQYRSEETIAKYRQQAINDKCYVKLQEQLRMHASKEVIDWIDSITKDKIIKKIPFDKKYEIEIFDSPLALEKAIRAKAEVNNTSLSRLVATYDWEYNGVRSPKEVDINDAREYWGVNINGWYKPWNYEKKDVEKKKIKDLAWAEQEHTLDEIGSTYTIQGFDLNYVGVILGPSVKYRNGKIVFDPSASKNKRATQKRTLNSEKDVKKIKQSFGEMFLQHEFKVLMTRGVNGLYIYACDDELRDALKKAKHPNAQNAYGLIEFDVPIAAEEQIKYGK